MATVKFKDESERIDFQGKREAITPMNLTWEKYERLMKEFPSLSVKFEVTEETPKSKKDGKAEN